MLFTDKRTMDKNITSLVELNIIAHRAAGLWSATNSC